MTAGSSRFEFLIVGLLVGAIFGGVIVGLLLMDQPGDQIETAAPKPRVSGWMKARIVSYSERLTATEYAVELLEGSHKGEYGVYLDHRFSKRLYDMSEIVQVYQAHNDAFPKITGIKPSR